MESNENTFLRKEIVGISAYLSQKKSPHEQKPIVLLMVFDEYGKFVHQLDAPHCVLDFARKNLSPNSCLKFASLAKRIMFKLLLP